MSLSCSCDFEPDEGDAWFYQHASDYSILNTKYSRKCTSCQLKIKPGMIVAKFNRSRYPKNEIEERIYGDDWEAISLAPYYLCEECADIYFSLMELGFECVSPDDSMRELTKEYHALYGSKK